MPRKPRLHVPGGVYHVILRGNHQEPLFATEGDRVYLNTLVGDVVGRFGLRVFAYCWMTNHLHLAVRVGNTPLGPPMQRLARAYSRYVHRNTGQVGHLFERRYRSILVDADAYLLALVRYIHLNPVAAGMVRDPAQYPWSSHADYLGRPTVRWIDTAFVLGVLPANGLAPRARYRAFMDAWTEADLEEFAGHEDRDTRRLEPRLPQPALPVARVEAALPAESLAQIATRHCAAAGIALGQLRSASRDRRLCEIRRAVAREALGTGAATVTEIATFLGRTRSALAQQLT